MSASKTKTFTCKFVKIDKFKNPVFTVSKDSNELSEGYKSARKYHRKLASKFETNLPIYVDKSKNYATIRFKKSEVLSKLKTGSIYTITFDFFENKMNDKLFINMVAKTIKFVKAQDNGTIYNIDSEIEISSDEE